MRLPCTVRRGGLRFRLRKWYIFRMIYLQEEESRKTTALLIGAPGDDLSELKGLVDTLGMETLRAVTLTRMEITPAYGMGKGKAEELSALAEEIGADVIIFDFDLDPRKQRNWEKLSKKPSFDRQEVILRIFAQRAQTKEAVLQVELARLEHSLPRLAHSYGDMARQRGGNFGSKGSGETQLELDTRAIREKIRLVKKELSAVVRDRETQRKRREKVPVPTCALAGYTNAGKSSLLNALTGADAFVEDKLFATLDPTTRKLQLANGANILLTDTVGFISNLPHGLVNAFKSTLEEAERANLIIIVIDASDPDAESQYRTVVEVLKEIGAENSPRIIALNKIDRIEEMDEAERILVLSRLENLFPENVKISAKNRTGFAELSEKICDALMGTGGKYVIPVEQQHILSVARKTGIVESEEWLDDGIHATIRAGTSESGKKLSAMLGQYKAE